MGYGQAQHLAAELLCEPARRASDAAANIQDPPEASQFGLPREQPDQPLLGFFGRAPSRISGVPVAVMNVLSPDETVERR